MNQKWFESKYSKQSLFLVYILTGLITVLLMGTSIYSLWQANRVYPTAELYQSYFPSDIINLIIGFPLLLLTLLLVRRGSLAGLLCWPGALFFVVYSYSL